ncbi:hypothetical protein SS50377_27404 [Spironucleus salmonicida]|uniref:Uncharacterized protein n=1 Tax=Spironucleus salmonicida TaxID=348837 RepID=V6LFI7_9EUKA|nr:hypothetical protein SS50377_27404 [Spironucleus salmonicida]|eukprot:EST43305.1 Hypothetical protein SS50377_16973 [Spironucleus salmonicida]
MSYSAKLQKLQIQAENAKMQHRIEQSRGAISFQSLELEFQQHIATQNRIARLHQVKYSPPRAFKPPPAVLNKISRRRSQTIAGSDETAFQALCSEQRPKTPPKALNESILPLASFCGENARQNDDFEQNLQFSAFVSSGNVQIPGVQVAAQVDDFDDNDFDE